MAWTLAVTFAMVSVVLLLPRDNQVASRDRPSSLETFQQRLAPGMLNGWNLLFITFDTLRADHLGCYGSAAAQTPTVDKLAARGVLFEHAITPVPATLPAHCTMMTGLEAPNHGVRTNGHFELKNEQVTLAEVLKDAGYATAAFVATFVLDPRFGPAQGFDTYVGIDVTRDQAGKSHAEPRLATRQTDDAIAWLDTHFLRNHAQPFFLWNHYFDPHLPYDPPREFAERFPDAPYDGEIAYADSQLGRLLDFLRHEEKLDRTLIVFTSDHGEGLGEHLEEDHSRLIYDTTMHVPLIISCPQLYGSASRVTDVTVGLIDVMPTILSLLGISTELMMDGLDLLTAPVPRDRAIYIETLAPLQYHAWASLHGLRRIDEKYIDAPHPEYFDLAADPRELNNLYGARPDRYANIATLLNERMARWPAADDVVQPNQRLSRAARENLAALGYVSTTDDTQPAPAIRLDPKDMVPIYEDLKRIDPLAWQAKSITLSMPPEADAGARRRALLLAGHAAERLPNDSACLLALGAAQYRNGHYDDAVQTLSQAEQILGPNELRNTPAIVMFHAMAEFRLGRHREARERLGAIAGTIGEPILASHDDVAVLLAEARSFIDVN